MSKHIVICITAISLLVIGISHLTLAKGPIRIDPFYHQLDLSNPNLGYAVHDRANAWLTIRNWGIIGLGDPSEDIPSCEFPRESDVEYLYLGSIWVGAVIQEGDSTFPRVSVGQDGWFGTNELFPGEGYDYRIIERSNIPGAVNSQGEVIYHPDAVAPQEFIATYTDTLTETFWVQNDPVDGPHRPLGIKIRQKSMVWDAFGFDDFILFDYTVENMGEDTLKNLYLGWYIDADIGWTGEMPHYHEDDLSGFLGIYEGDTLNVGYSNDNDGRPYEVASGSNFTSPGVAGTYILQSPDNPAHLSFNWWISNGNPEIDFGPCWQAYADSSGWEWMSIYGTPMGDLRKYQVMSNREIDYDQVMVDQPAWIAANPQQFFNNQGQLIEEQPWLPPNASDPTNLANGYDTRYLMSWGPMGENTAPPGQEPETYLYPGDSISLVLSHVCADSFHDFDNPQNSNEIIDPTKYVYDDLVYNCQQVQFLYDHNFQVLPPYAPENFRITESTDDYIQMEWDAYTTMPFTMIDFYRKTESGPYGEDPINPMPLSGTVYHDYDITLGTHYTYKAQAIRYVSLRSYYSEEAPQLAGAPITPTGLVALSSHNESVPLSWDANTEPDLDHYNIYRADSTGAYQPIGTSTAPQYTDQNLTNGMQYSYKISAEDFDHYESDLSDSASATPMGFQQELLVIIHHTSYSLFNWENDSLDAFYQTLFAEIGESPDFHYIEDYDAFPTMVDVSPYRIIWVIGDSRDTAPFSYMSDRDQVLNIYLSLGGNVIYSGRKLMVGVFGTSSGWSFLYQLLLEEHFRIVSIRAATWPPLTYPIGFIGAEAVMPEIASLSLDSAKVALLSGPPDAYTMEVDGLEPDSLADIFYTYVSSSPDSSEFHGMATGIRYDSLTAMLTFPLYAMEPYDAVLDLAENIMEYIRGGYSYGVEDNITEPLIPKDYALHQNYPNPFNASTIVPFALPAASKVNLTVYNIIGRKVMTVADGWYDAGTHRVFFDGANLASGVYFYQLKAGNFVNVKKMVLLK